MTATVPRRPVPRPPSVSGVILKATLDAQATAVDIAIALAHRTARRSSQELDTALLEVRDATAAVRALCPLTDAVHLEPEAQARADAAHLRLDNAVIRAAAAGATATQIHTATNGALR